MRIIAGKFRRRRIRTRPGETTRPITDRAKEILFERLSGDIVGKRIADVFAGTGTLGLEAISRGAAGAVFIENDRRAFALLRENVELLGAAEQALCWRTDATRSSFRPDGVDHLLPYNTVFFDPPYKLLGELETGRPIYGALERLARVDVSAEKCLLVLRTPRRTELELPSAWAFDRVLDLRSMEAHLYERRPLDDSRDAGEDRQSRYG